MEKKSRDCSLDLLRIIALYAVIIVHACGTGTHVLPISDKNWQILTFIAAMMTWQVPAFVMVSGRFFLDPSREVTFHRIFRKSIPRLVSCFIVWDIVYQIYYIYSGAYQDLNWKGILSQFIVGPYHFWYLWMLICLYMIVPFLRKITSDKQLMEYFIVLFIVGEFFGKYGGEIPCIGNLIEVVVSHSNFHFAIGYSGYFVLGYYLIKYPLSIKKELFLYTIGLLLLGSVGFLTVWDSLLKGENRDLFSSYLTPNTIIVTSAIYMLFTKRIKNIQFSDVIERIIVKLSELSFGVFLIHALVIEILAVICPVRTTVHPISGIIVLSISCVVISNLLVAAMKKIPFICKIVT